LVWLQVLPQQCSHHLLKLVCGHHLLKLASLPFIIASGSFQTPSNTRGGNCAGSKLISELCMALFFASIGAAAGHATLSGVGPVVLFVAVQLAVHSGVVVAAAALLRIPTSLALIASNAAVGGPATAAAMAGARQWPQLVPAAVMLGGLGYGIGTWVGLCVHHMFLLA
jgi:uncharacterized membrane protein